MLPSVSDIVRYRYIATFALRLLGLSLVVYSLVPFASWLSEGLSDGDLLYFGYYLPRILLASFACGGGIVFLLLAPLLARVAMPIHRNTAIRCPRCAYRVDHTSTSRSIRICSECGLVLPVELLDPESHHHADLPAAVNAWNAHVYATAPGAPPASPPIVTQRAVAGAPAARVDLPMDHSPGPEPTAPDAAPPISAPPDSARADSV